MKDLSNYRKSYEKSELLENQIPEDPINLFHKWFYEAEELNAAEEVNAMTVTTIGLDGFPKARVVLLKKFNEEGFIFYTNYNSEKGKAILNNPNVCLSFFWPTVLRFYQLSLRLVVPLRFVLPVSFLQHAVPQALV